LGESENGGGQADTKKGGSTGGTDGIWNMIHNWLWGDSEPFLFPLLFLLIKE